jgi:hypothetical protein
MTIYKACAKIDTKGIEEYFVKLEDAIERVNNFLKEEYKRWGVDYDFEYTKEVDNDIYFIHKVHTYATRSDYKSVLGIQKVTLNE